MDRVKSILLLAAFMVSIAPWGLLDVCAQHLERHEHDGEHHGTCAEGMMGDHHEEDASLPSLKATSCTALVPATEAYQATDQLTLPTAKQFVIVAVLFELIQWELPEQAFFPLPDPESNSDPPLGINALRGPPFV